MTTTTAKKNYWLMKSEPDVYSIDDFARDRTTHWEGVRNFKARNYMRSMTVGDGVFFYHSNAGSIIAYLPSTLPLAYVAQRTRSTWPGIIAHTIGNRTAVIAIYQAITR